MSTQPVSEAVSAAPRLRLWQIEHGMLCSVLGTCLSLNDLHIIARRARYKIDPGTSAYRLHSWFVDRVASLNDLSKIADKELEKRHAKPAQLVRRAQSEEEIEARFKEVSATGQIAGAYWGAMSHPLCTGALRWRLFGEIHMLSHLVGSSRRSDLARVHGLEATCAELDGELAQLKHEHRCTLKDRRRLEEELDERRRAQELANRRLAATQERLAGLESQTLVRSAEERLAELERDLRTARERLATTEATLSLTRADLAESLRAEERARGLVLDLSAENAALELELVRRVAPLETPAAPELADEADLSGKRILCVGGRSSLVQHYRALVERRGGAFLHHDGGLEESLDAVTRALSTIDAVVCPVDCVSHAAYWKVKRACKHLAKQLIVLRSSGLSSFALGLQTVGQPAARSDSARVVSVVEAKL